MKTIVTSVLYLSIIISYSFAQTAQDYFNLGVENYFKAHDEYYHKNNKHAYTLLYKEAIQNFKKAESNGIDTYELYDYLATSEMRISNYQEAILYYTKASNLIEDSRTLLRCLAFRGECKNKVGDYRGAILDLTKSIELANLEEHCNPQNEYFERGFARFNLGDFENSILDYSKAIELDQNDKFAYYNRGLARIKLGEKEKGCLDLSKAGELGLFEAYTTIQKVCN